jgi:hypothetical protein
MPRTKNTGTTTAPTQQTQEQTPAPAPAVAPAAPEPEPATNPTSMFDDAPPEPPVAEQPNSEPAAPSEPSAEDRAEGVDGVQEETPPAAPELVIQEMHANDVAPVAAPPAADPDSEPSSVAPTEVRLGQAIGLLHRLPLSDVLAYADTFAEKIEAMTFSAKVQALQPRMRVSEGRCAPVYFTMNDDFEPEHLLAGDDALSAAKAIGLETVFVILIYPGDADVVQGYLNGKRDTDAGSTEDDELVWQANGYHADS